MSPKANRGSARREPRFAQLTTAYGFVAEERDTIEDVIGRYLIQRGYFQRTLRERIATMAADRHLGVVPPSSGTELFDGT